MRQAPAIILEQRGQLPILTDIQVHDPGPNEVLVKMVASGVCHTDLTWVRDGLMFPVVLGHEGAGIVEKTGDNVTMVRLGDHVVINWRAKCHRCRRCLSGQSHLCENVQATAAPRLFWNGTPLSVMLNAGTFCPRVVVPEMGAIAIRKDIPLDKAALLGCGVATGVGAVLYAAKVQPGENVVVIGTGGVGLNVIQGARLANAGQIIAVDLRDRALEHAKQFGATHIFNNTERDPVAYVREVTNGRGVEHVFEVVGHSEAITIGLGMLARGGILTSLGAAARDAEASFNPRQLQSYQQKIQACMYGDIRPEIDLPLFADWYMDGRLKLDELHTATIRLEDTLHEFTEHGHREGIRTVIAFH